ncbi:MAG: glycosyltransferase [Candidatus Berkelbacteria bacterium]|nr:glycosyltransferase [Candidatus Berkelbacteria bacterium]MCR4307904.1 glycosyltransferase [Candidatus Berkelbacteria bacterium]
MKIIIGSVTYPLANGVTTSINTSVDGFVAAGHKVVIVAPRYDGLGKIRPEHFPVSSSEIGRWFMSALHKKERLFSVTSAGEEIEKIVQDFKPDAFWLHTLTWAPNAFEKAMLKSDRPNVLTYHTLVEDYGRAYAGEIGAWRMRTRSRDVASIMDAVIVPSQVIAKRLSLYGVRKNMDVIPTGIHIPETAYTKREIAERFHFPADTNLLLYVGRVSREKNIVKLIQMTQPLLQDQKTVLLLVGPGDLVETQDQAEKWGVARQVICSGALPKEDTQKIYGAADAFVFASQTETQGLVIGEAMLAGTPVVALYSPIQPEVYPDNVAVVVHDPRQFANSVKELLANESHQKILTTKAKEFVEDNFSINGMITKQIALFERLVK